MGKKKDLRRAIEKAEAASFTPPAPPTPTPPDASGQELVQISMILTEGDRLRLRRLGIELDTSLQRLGHRAWNAFLASHGQLGLTPVLQGNAQPPRTSGERHGG